MKYVFCKSIKLYTKLLIDNREMQIIVISNHKYRYVVEGIYYCKYTIVLLVIYLCIYTAYKFLE